MSEQTTVPLKDLFKEALKKSKYQVHKTKKRKKWTTKSGFYKVQKKECRRCKQGFTWTYRIDTPNGRHTISRTDILKLKKDILDMGLKWSIINEENAKKTAKETHYKLDMLR